MVYLAALRGSTGRAHERDCGEAVAYYFYWIEQSTFSTWLRESPSLLVFPTILLLHTIGMGFLAGTNAAIDLRVLGVAPRMRIAPMQKFYPLMWSGFWVNLATGLLLIIAYPTQAFTNPVFYIKLGFIALAVTNTLMIRRAVFADPRLDEMAVPTRWKILATTSLFFWAGAITAGRLLPYTTRQLMTNNP
jgi:hypothetical protein